MAPGVVPQHAMVAQRPRQIQAELAIALATGGEAVQLDDERAAGARELVVEDGVGYGKAGQRGSVERRSTGIW